MNTIINRMKEYDSQIYNLLINRSTFYNLEPIGIGTPYVESLTSYITRLANKHNVSVFKLIIEFIDHIGNKTIKENILNGKYKPHTLNGNSSEGIVFVNALEILTTRKDIIYMTLNPWSGILPKNIIGKNKKWCPVCLNKWLLKDHEVYEPLIWSMSGVNICTLHETKLEDKCPHCQKSLPLMTGKSVVGYCNYCFGWLGEVGSNEEKEIVTDNEKFKILNFQQLLESAPGLDSLPTIGAISGLLKEIMLALNVNKIKDLANFLEIDQSYVSTYLKNKHIPSINTLLFIAEKVNSTIYDMLCKQEFTFGPENTLLGKISNPKVFRETITNNKIERLLIKAVNGEMPKSLSRISNEIGVSPEQLKKHFPVLSQKIINNYYQYQERLRVQKKKQIEHKLNTALKQEKPISLNEFSEYYDVPINTAKRCAPALVTALTTRYRDYIINLKNERTIKYKNEIENIILKFHELGIAPSIHMIQKEISNPRVLIEEQFRKFRKEKLISLGYDL